MSEDELRDELMTLLVAGHETTATALAWAFERLTRNPRVLAELCRRLRLAFDEAMLSWPAGPKPEDGVWAPHWYDAVHRSTGWAPYREKHAELLPGVVPAYEQSLPLYERLLPYRIS